MLGIFQLTLLELKTQSRNCGRISKKEPATVLAGPNWNDTRRFSMRWPALVATARNGWLFFLLCWAPSCLGWAVFREEQGDRQQVPRRNATSYQRRACSDRWVGESRIYLVGDFDAAGQAIIRRPCSLFRARLDEVRRVTKGAGIDPNSPLPGLVSSSRV
jgi:hypothetical protein